jgi:Na+/phosphate symporter
MADVVQVVGALFILVPFASQQLRGLSPASAVYLWPNLVGSAILAVLAAAGEQWGFLLLEVVWALVACRGLILLARGSAPAHP